MQVHRNCDKFATRRIDSGVKDVATTWVCLRQRRIAAQAIPFLICKRGFFMNVHEYQAKELLAKYGVGIPAGIAALTVEEAVAAAKQLPGPIYVVKAQIHAGGRGKGKFKELPPTPRVACASPRASRKSRFSPRKCSATPS
jgi:hypothetical protein